MPSARIRSVLACIGSGLLALACSDSRASEAPAAARVDSVSPKASPAAAADTALEAYRTRLLELGSKVAGLLPLEPHAKTRARLQAELFDTLLELGQATRAGAEIERMGGANWRRGAACADLALRFAQQGRQDEAMALLQRAGEVAGAGEPTITQDWQKDRIRAKTACALERLGRHADAQSLGAGLTRSEAGRLDEQRAAGIEDSGFEALLAELERGVATGDFDLRRNALGTCARLHRRFYLDPERRELLEQRIREFGAKIPLEVQLETAVTLVDDALDCADRAHALELIADGKARMDAVVWLPENKLPWLARFAVLRQRAGEAGPARIELDAARRFLDAQRAKIVDIYRAGAARALAEAYAASGEPSTALTLYRQAVEDGLANPNSKPRAEDLCTTLRSMAKCAVEPDAALWERIEQAAGALGDPW